MLMTSLLFSNRTPIVEYGTEAAVVNIYERDRLCNSCEIGGLFRKYCYYVA